MLRADDRSISTSFSWTLIAIVALLLIQFAIVVSLINLRRADSELQNNLQTYLQLSEVSLRIPIWNVNFEIVEAIVESLLVNNLVVRAEVNEGSDVLAVSAVEGFADQSFEQLELSKGMLTGSIDIEYEGELIGTLRLAMTREPGRRQMLTEIIAIILLTLLIAGGIALTSTFVLRRLVSAPLRRLQSSASAIASGQLDTPIDIHRNNEIGHLANDFDAMRQSVKNLVVDLRTANHELATANQTLEDRVQQRTAELERSNTEVVESHKQIVESMHYASRIQAAMLPSRQLLSQILPRHFLIWEPRDIVGGDFYWCQRSEHGRFVVVGDCTGHGVPGAFMTLIACGLLDQLILSGEPSPAVVLSKLHQQLQSLLGQDVDNGDTDDGLDAGICLLRDDSDELLFAGARFSLFSYSDSGINELRGDRAGIGYRRYPAETSFSDQIVAAPPSTTFYMSTDGIFDQIGGNRRLAFGKKRFTGCFEHSDTRTLSRQETHLSHTFASYQGDERRRDDVTVLCFSNEQSAKQIR